ncbi:type VI secretion system baseplate subunit TssG [Rhizobium laguerreae]|nr:type VI secretion system baseplate subunit TssG [Rhizobium laguerreae]
MSADPIQGKDPHTLNFYQVLRTLERDTPKKPRIGDSATLAEEVVLLSQDPFLAFPSANVSAVSYSQTGTLRLHTRFLGMFGPQGALPLHMTEDAQRWFARDPSFARFVDIISTRFLQLFYRAWADARPIGQAQRPDDDRFFGYLGSFVGIATKAMREIDTVGDGAKIPFAGLANIQVKSASTLQQFLHGIFRFKVEVEEWIGSWLIFDQSECMRLGGAQAVLGSNAYLGSRMHTISERIRVRIHCRDRSQYEALLPGGLGSRRLGDALFSFCGHHKEIEVELGLPARQAPGLTLGQSGQLGWTSWLSPPREAPEGQYCFEARFNPMIHRTAQ